MKLPETTLCTEPGYNGHMDINDYQKQARDSVVIDDKSISALSHRGFGLAGEAGHVADIIKLIIRDQDGVATPEDIALLKKRLGDVMYYTAVLAEYFDLPLADIAQQNLDQSADFKTARD